MTDREFEHLKRTSHTGDKATKRRRRILQQRRIGINFDKIFENIYRIEDSIASEWFEKLDEKAINAYYEQAIEGDDDERKMQRFIDHEVREDSIELEGYVTPTLNQILRHLQIAEVALQALDYSVALEHIGETFSLFRYVNDYVTPLFFISDTLTEYEEEVSKLFHIVEEIVNQTSPFKEE